MSEVERFTHSKIVQFHEDGSVTSLTAEFVLATDYDAATARAEQAERDLTTSCDQTIAANARADRLQDGKEAAERLAQEHGWPGYSQGGNPVTFLYNEVIDQAQRADQAEADNAALVKLLKEEALDKIYDLEGETYRIGRRKIEAALVQPHPGSRLLELAQIVEGLPKWSHVEWRSEHTDKGRWAVKGSNGYYLGDFFNKEDADALARLLAWRVQA